MNFLLVYISVRRVSGCQSPFYFIECLNGITIESIISVNLKSNGKTVFRVILDA